MAAITVRVAEETQGKKIGLRYAASTTTTLSSDTVATSLCVEEVPLSSFRSITSSVPVPIGQVGPAVAMEWSA
jgi:hypothetical protein